MGIDKNDKMIRRRLRQKMEFMLEDISALETPSDEALQAFCKEYSDHFRTSSSYTFEQAYLNPDRTESELVEIIALQQQRIENGENPLSDLTLLPQHFENIRRPQLDSRFGKGFAGQLDDLTPGEWHGPVQSGVGLNFVMIENRSLGILPDLEDIRDSVLEEWEYQKRQQFKVDFETRLPERYEVQVVWPGNQLQSDQ